MDPDTDRDSGKTRLGGGMPVPVLSVCIAPSHTQIDRERITHSKRCYFQTLLMTFCYLNIIRVV